MSARIWLAVLKLWRKLPPLLLFKSDPQGSALFYRFFSPRAEASVWLAPFALWVLFIRLRFWADFFLKQGGLSKISPLVVGEASFPYRVFIVTCWNNKPTAGYLWFWYAVPFKRKLSLRSGGSIIGLLPTKEAVGRVRKCGKNLRRLSRRKFELKRKILIKDKEAVVYLKFT